MSALVTIDLDDLVVRLPDDELAKFMLDTFKNRVNDDMQSKLIVKIFNGMYETDKEDAIVQMLSGMHQPLKSLDAFLKTIPINERGWYKDVDLKY